MNVSSEFDLVRTGGLILGLLVLGGAERNEPALSPRIMHLLRVIISCIKSAHNEEHDELGMHLNVRDLENMESLFALHA